jgi:glycosyltransferase involved in cell wall biosynthesis
MKEKNPQISVLIPAYRAEKYIAEAIESALNQTLKPFEVIVVEDGSPDKLYEVAKEYEPNVLLFKKVNEGISKTRNFALQKSSGNLIAFLDADDYWPENHLESLFKKMEESKHTDMVFGSTREFVSPELNQEQIGKSRKELFSRVPVPGSILIKKEVFEKVGVYDESLQAAEFIDWFDRTKNKGILSESIDEIVLFRRLHLENNGVVNKNSQQDYLKVLRASLARKKSKKTQD